MSLVHTLKKLGFSDKKAAVYLSLLTNGELTASEIAKQTNLQRTTVYDIIKALKKNSLVSAASGKNDKQIFLADDPANIEALVGEKANWLNKQRQDVEKQQTELKDIIPQLKSLNEKAVGKPRIHLFDGAKGLVEALNDCLLKKQPIYIYGPIGPWRRWMPDHFEWYGQQVEKRHIEVKRIEQKSIEKLRGMEPDEVVSDWPVKFLPVGFNLTGTNLIYGEKVMIAQFQRPMATIIEDKDYAATQLTIFRLFWQFLRNE